jgi:hypothetical protein
MGSLTYCRHRFPASIIQHAVWLYLRFKELLAERGIDVSYETVRRWVLKFGPLIARLAAAGLTEPRCASERGLAMGGGRPAERPFTVGGSGKSVARCHRTVVWRAARCSAVAQRLRQ